MALQVALVGAVIALRDHLTVIQLFVAFVFFILLGGLSVLLGLPLLLGVVTALPFIGRWIGDDGPRNQGEQRKGGEVTGSFHVEISCLMDERLLLEPALCASGCRNR